MKKKLVASLAAAMVIGVAGTSFAATNPFVDVPAKHWAYDAVSSLAKAGVIDGTGNGKFDGGATLTRYEMAQFVAKAMAHSDKADAAQKATIDKLAAEFASELEGLNVRVTNVENKLDNVKWSGEVRERFDRQKAANDDVTYKGNQTYIDLFMTAQINPDWIAKVEYESTKKMLNTNTTDDNSQAGGDGGESNASKIFAQGNAFGGKATIGKFDPFTAYGLVMDDSMTGAEFDFGNKLQTRVGYGKWAANGLTIAGSSDDATVGHSPAYAFAELGYSFGKTNVKAAYHKLSDLATATINTLGGKDSVGIVEAGFDTKIGENFSLMATYSKSDIDTISSNDVKNSGYLAQVMYKAADTKKAGSYDIYTQYRNIPYYSTIAPTWDYSKVKGFQVGFDYVPATNIKVNAFYMSGKDLSDKTTYDTGSDLENSKWYRAQVEFFF